MCLRKPEAPDPPGAGVPRSGEPLMSGRADTESYALLTAERTSQPYYAGFY